MLPKAAISHQIPGRTRFYIPDKKDERSFFIQMEEKLLSLPGVVHTRSNPTTASILIHHSVPRAELVKTAKENSLFELDEALGIHRRWPEDLVSQANRIDRKITKITDGEMNLASLLALGLLGAGAFQVSRRQLFPAASTLIADAVRILIQINRTSSRKISPTKLKRNRFESKT